MKPIRLEMTAFGPYKEKTVVDFEKLGDNLFAVCGPTGAGKTTIFDALMFALFGEVSSQSESASNKDTSAFRSVGNIRCNLVDDKTDTVVKLIFSEKGKEYTVIRKIHVTPSKVNMDASLEGDGRSAEKPTKVNEEIKNILGGVDATRFRRIVMLAQGQFKAFMEAKDEDRKAILGQLFDSAPYKEFQLRLKAVADQLQKMQAEGDREVRAKLQRDVFLLPEDTSEETWAAYSPDTEPMRLIENLERLLEADASEADSFSEADRLYGDKRDKLNGDIAKAEIENGLYTELQEKKAKLSELEGQTEAMQRKESETEETDRALHQVKPKEDAYIAAEGALEEACKKTETAETNLAVAKEKLVPAKEDADKNPARKKEAEALRGTIQGKKERLPEYQKLDEARKNRETAAASLDTETRKKEAAEQKSMASLAAIAVMDKELTELVDAERREADADTIRLKAADEVFRIVDPWHGFLAKVTEVKVLEDAARFLLEDAERIQLQAEKAAAEYSDISKRYFAGYARVLGSKLDDEIRETGQGVCPVCGMLHTTPVTLSDQEEPVKEEEVTEAENRKDTEEKRAKQARDEFVSKNHEFQAHRDTLLKELQDVYPEQGPWDWDCEALQKKLELIRQEKQAESDAQNALWEKAKKDTARKKELLVAKEQEAEKQKEYSEEKQSAEVAAARAQKDVSMYETEIERLTGSLQSAGLDVTSTAEKASEEIAELERREAGLQEQITQAEQALEAANQSVAACEATLNTEKSHRESMQNAYEKRKTEWEETLSDAGFAEQTYRFAMARIGDTDGEIWLKEQRSVIEHYKSEIRTLTGRIAELEVKPPVYTDTTEAKEQLETVKEQLSTLARERSAFDKRQESHATALATVKRVQTEQKAVQAAYLRMKNLSEVANGYNTSGGKRTFDGYVLGHYFREMLGEASGYLERMSGGKYVLCHDEAAVGAHSNAFANFRISVEDRVAGKTREIGTLSGGESFEAAMALALGLSDAVQSHHSSVSIDTLFIDEGFGTLDKDTLHNVLAVLFGLTEKGRQVGIISHVDELREQAIRFINVVPSKNGEGSHLVME